MRKCCDGNCKQGRYCPERVDCESWIRANLWFDRIFAFCCAVVAFAAFVLICYLFLMLLA